MSGLINRLLNRNNHPTCDTLHECVFSGRYSLTKKYLEDNFKERKDELRAQLGDVTLKYGEQEKTPLMLAIARNYEDIVRLLLDYYEKLGIKCTLGFRDALKPGPADDPNNVRRNVLELAIYNYNQKDDHTVGQAHAWKILKMVFQREHKECAETDGVEIPFRTATKEDGKLKQILDNRYTTVDELLGWAHRENSGFGWEMVATKPSPPPTPKPKEEFELMSDQNPPRPPRAAFEPSDFREPNLESILYGLEEMALSSADKRVLTQTLISRIQTLSPADRSAVAWLNKELNDLIIKL